MKGEFRFSYLDQRVLSRLRTMRAKSQPLARAIGVKAKKNLRILDLTFGFGVDALCMTQWGCQVIGAERHPLIYQQAQNALLELKESDLKEAKLTESITLVHADGIQILRNRQIELGQDSGRSVVAVSEFDVVYLDPMYEIPKNHSARPKRSAQFLRDTVGADDDQDELFELALKSGIKRIVLKANRHVRPKLRPLHTVGEKIGFWYIYG